MPNSLPLLPPPPTSRFLSLRRLTAPPPLPLPVCVPHRRGDQESSPGSARGGAAALPVAGGERRGGRLAPPRTSQVGAEQPLTEPPVRRHRERGTAKLLLSTSSPPPFGSCPSRKWSVALGYPYFFGLLRGARIQRLPSGVFRCWRVSLCGSARHTSVDDEERSTGDSGPLRTGTGIRVANARATCPGPPQCQRYRLGRSR